ncbi:hypothetical protein MAPG_05958 [Magnaporthiopsis poae ATCC 64411]|uniref:Serine protease n=1 Tax=Magnaporthiopsis poae (strain ATCC 64411 / 73-15) TaxID=644358 RepID=A0A0C4E0S4_MAGP6|nr:hypothetical protein MAPG_05958 [Magnaporthiopsis poae ATCC 64411]
MAQAAVWTLSTASGEESMPVPSQDNYSREHGGEDRGESIIGVDGRMPVYPQLYQDGGPYRSVVKIQTRFRNAQTGAPVWMMGSGWLIEPNLVVTAGHVAYDWTQNFKEAQEIRCYIGYRGRASIPTTSEDEGSDGKTPAVQGRLATKVVTTAQWIQNNNDRTRTKDVAFLQLDKPFKGNLNLFKYTNATPPSASGVILGVVGYPGDKSLGSESGAEMYEQFAPTDYNIAKNKNNMIEYKVSTFGGQSGAPIIRREDGLVIGTHCYGGGGGDGNSGNSIGGTYGNNYSAFIGVFSMRVAAAKSGKAVLVPLGETTANGTGKNQSRGNGSNGSSQGAECIPARGGDTEGFLDIIGGLIGTALPIAGSVIGGPIGGAVAGVASSVIGALTGAESMEDDGSVSSAAPDRAVLAEAALQTIMALNDGPEVDRLLDHVREICKDGVPNLDGIASKLRPVLTKHVAQMAVQAMNQNETVLHPPAEAAVDDPVRRPLKENRTESELSSDYKGKDLYECLMTPTIPVPGEEAFLDHLGPLISKALRAAKPIASQVAKKAVEKYGPQVIAAITGTLGGAESSMDDEDMLNDGAVHILLGRAYVADASLQALSSLSKSDLQKLKLSPEVAREHGLHEEGVIDFLKTAAQTLGPLALQTGKAIAPIALDCFKNAIAGESAAVNDNNNSGGSSSNRHLSVRDRLSNNARKRSMPRLNDAFKVSGPGLFLCEQVEEYDDGEEEKVEEQPSYRMMRRRSIDSNPDGLIPSYSPPPLPRY